MVAMSDIYIMNYSYINAIWRENITTETQSNKNLPLIDMKDLFEWKAQSYHLILWTWGVFHRTALWNRKKQNKKKV